MASSLLLFGLAGVAFGVVPRTTTEEPVSVTEVELPLAVSATVVTQEPGAEIFVREERTLRGDGVHALLSRLQVVDTEASRFLATPSAVRLLAPSNGFRQAVARVDGDGLLHELQMRSERVVLTVRRGPAGFVISEEPAPLERRIEVRTGSIRSSLFAATDDAGVPDVVASAFADVFSGEVDLHRDLRTGDRFSIVYETVHVQGEEMRPGRLLAAEFVNQGRTLRAFYSEDEQGRGGYFSADGQNLRRSFLKSPIEFSRVTSGFSSARLHPVLQVVRAHRGVDYGAPTGTRVRVTADGTVSFAGWQAGYGNTVLVRHARGHETLYGHLSGFTALAKAGARVEQGDIIGFVGMTGLTSGPHLHYEFHVNGVHVDPNRFVPQAGPTVSASSRASFRRSVEEHLARLESIRGLELASVE